MYQYETIAKANDFLRKFSNIMKSIKSMNFAYPRVSEDYKAIAACPFEDGLGAFSDDFYFNYFTKNEAAEKVYYCITFEYANDQGERIVYKDGTPCSLNLIKYSNPTDSDVGGSMYPARFLPDEYEKRSTITGDISLSGMTFIFFNSDLSSFLWFDRDWDMGMLYSRRDFAPPWKCKSFPFLFDHLKHNNPEDEYYENYKPELVRKIFKAHGLW